MSASDQEFEEGMTGLPASSPPASTATRTSLLAEPAPVAITLPSRAILYKNDPKVGNIDKDGQVFIRPIVMDDMEIFMTPELIETGTVIDSLFNRCIQGDVNPKYLLVSDRNYLLMYIRAQSYGPEYSFKFSCTNGGCSKTITQRINLGELPVIYLDDIHGEKNDKGEVVKSSLKNVKEPFECQLSMSGAKVWFNLPRGIDESEQASERHKRKLKKELEKKTNIVKRGDKTIIKNVDPYEDQATMIDDDDEEKDTLFDTLRRSIIRVESSDGSEILTEDNHIEIFVRRLLAGDLSELQQYIRNYDSGIDMNITVKCPSCKFPNDFLLPLTESFFRRELRPRK